MSLPGVASVAQIGLELRVLLEPGGSDPAVLRAALAGDASARIEPAAPSLEAVFAAATRARAGAPQAAA